MKLKKRTLIISLVLAFILCLSFVLTGFLTSRIDVNTREINVNEIGTISYEEKYEKLKSKFDKIETNTEGDIAYFSGDINLDSINFVNTEYEDCTVVNNYKSEINLTTDVVNLTSNLVVDGEIVDTKEVSVSAEYDEENDQIFVIDENGNKIDILASLEEENFEDCALITGTLIALSVKEIVALVVVAGVSIYVKTNASEIASGLSVLVNGVRDGVVSVWERLKSACGYITASLLAEPIFVLTKSIATKINKLAKNRKNQYLLCGTITGNSPIPIVSKFTDVNNAKNWVKKGGSIWAPFATGIKTAFKKAGYKAGGTKGGNKYIVNLVEHHKSSNNIPTFDHYHTIINGRRVNHSVHGFFGLPYV